MSSLQPSYGANEMTPSPDEGWTSELCESMLVGVVEAMKTLVVTEKESTDYTYICPEWDRVNRLYELVVHVPEKLGTHFGLDIETYRSNEEFMSAYRAQKMIVAMRNILLKTRSHGGFNEATVTDDIMFGVDTIRKLVAENQNKTDRFAKLINNDFLPFLKFQMVNVISRNTSTLPILENKHTTLTLTMLKE